MLSNLKKLVLTTLLLLSSAASAPIEARDEASNATIEASGGMHHLKFLLHRHKSCKPPLMYTMQSDIVQSGKCTHFHRPFAAFEVKKSSRWEGREKYWPEFGNCTLNVYLDKQCGLNTEGKVLTDPKVLSLPGVNSRDSKALKFCNDGAKTARSVKIVCMKDGKQVDEVPMNV